MNFLAGITEFFRKEYTLPSPLALSVFPSTTHAACLCVTFYLRKIICVYTFCTLGLHIILLEDSEGMLLSFSLLVTCFPCHCRSFRRATAAGVALSVAC